MIEPLPKTYNARAATVTFTLTDEVLDGYAVVTWR
jgi:hypothetical protein